MITPNEVAGKVRASRMERVTGLRPAAPAKVIAPQVAFDAPVLATRMVERKVDAETRPLVLAMLGLAS